MKAVVEYGTGKRLQSDFYVAAGKTGSAEFGGNADDSHAWFTGFAPADDPQISVTIIVESIGSGGEYAVPIAKRIIDAYFGVY
jgi:peptidoglycan glycosyltransferase